MSLKRIYSPGKNHLFQKNDFDLKLNGLTTPSTTTKIPLTTKNIFKSNADNIIFNDYPLFTSPNNNISEKKEANNDLFNLESKIKSLEYKLILLDQKNESLLAKINSNEENFDMKLKKLENNNLEGKKNLLKAENSIALLNKMNNDNSAEIKKKISFIHNNLQKEEEYKNEQRKLDIELQKNILNSITEKIKETIKAEVDARFKADMENKILNENIYKNTENEIMKLKKEIEDINNNVISKIKTISKECSERAHNVSKYTDQQISNALLGKNEVQDNMKKYMEQFILQVKDNITAQNTQNRLFDDRLKGVEIHLDKSKNDNFGYMSEVEKRFEKKMNTLKKYFEINMKKHDNFLDSNIKNFALAIDKNFNFISGLIIDIRLKENEIFKTYQKKSEEKFKSIISDLEKICQRIYQYENSLNVFDKQNDLLKKNVAESLVAVKTRLDVHKVNQKILYTIENNLMQEQIIYLKKDLESSTFNILSNLNEFKESSQNSISTIMLELERHQKIMDINAKNTNQRFNNIDKRNEENEVKQIMEEILNNIENINLINSLQNSKTSEYEINQIIKKQQIEINALNTDNRQSKIKSEEFNSKLNELEKRHDNSINNLSENLNNVIKIQNQARELELTEAVSNCMNIMIANVENEITKEKMDDFSKYDFTKMTTTLADLSDKVKTVKSSNKTNSEEISDIKLSIKSLEEKVSKNNSSLKNSDLNIKIAMNQMLNNVEFNNIYSLIKNNKNQNIDFNEDFRQKCSEIVDNKIRIELEKVKIENENLWKKAVEASTKMNKPEEIKQVIDKVPPTVLPINESAKRLMDVDYFNGENENPKLPLLEDKLKLIEEDNEKKENGVTKQEEVGGEKESDEIEKKGKPDKNDDIKEENNVDNKEENKEGEIKEDSNKEEENEEKENKEDEIKEESNKEDENEEGEKSEQKENEEEGEGEESKKENEVEEEESDEEEK